ncbi:hypothetical protein GGI25_000030 [Coemansia spiralis]|uniref:EamA domain-containing protein n=2 Tax=Coemansia TaxID=4863 RepID=A0A9W8GDB1_9FUNG|nr:hypothetical protein BX070DRAFT_218881 [Coemansia spiralis]KAJ1989862.1 hypothetical protein EDC05_004393 [Coemansia umbellata]KAJ2623092.1 hypothetical protein GGI26_002702 [Coemansia sp. RSA 1358]KAJ2681076.1 hypothetical protein GGI25_000030 [Coemansia spiralis]
MNDNRHQQQDTAAYQRVADEETPLLRSDDTAVAVAATEAETGISNNSSTRSSAEEAARRRRDELKGYVFMAVSALGFATNSACVKALAISNFPSLEIVFARSVMQLGLGLLGCLFYRINPVGPIGSGSWPVRKLLILRGAAGAFGNACFFYSVTVMTLADATVVFFTGPVFSAIFANLLLGEPYGRFDRTASAICMLGIAFVLKPTALFGPRVHDPSMMDIGSGDSSYNQLRGAAAALIGAMSGALAYCVVRKVGRSVHSMVHVVYFGFLSMIGSAAAMGAALQTKPAPRLPNTLYEWAVMGMVGTFAFFGQALLNRGLQLAPAGPGTLMRNLDVVFAFLFGITLFDEVPDWISIGGAIVIVGCTVAMGMHKWISHSRQQQ